MAEPEIITGTLKYVSATKAADGWALTATDQWSNGDEKVFVFPTEALDALRQINVVVEDGVWESDGKPKWKVQGEPHIEITKTFHSRGKKPTATVELAGGNGSKPARDRHPDVQKPEPVSPASPREGWKALRAVYLQSVAIAQHAWPAADEKTVCRAAATLFIQAAKSGLGGVDSDE